MNLASGKVKVDTHKKVWVSTFVMYVKMRKGGEGNGKQKRSTSSEME